MWRLLALCALVAVACAESVRETAIMNSAGDIFSGSLPDDEDLIDPLLDHTEDDRDDGDADGNPLISGFGSGEEEISNEDDANSSVSELPIDNRIPDGGPRNDVKETNDNDLLIKNEVVPERSQPLPDDSNEIPMAITGHEGFFQRTEVIIALIAGGVVGLLFAVFLILLLYFRMKKKDEGSYDLGKKPIYKKAPTNEFYA